MQPRDMVENERFVVVYKCRHCGALEARPDQGQRPGGPEAADLLLDAAQGKKGAPALVWPHVCSERKAGICDLIGAIPEKEAMQIIRGEG